MKTIRINVNFDLCIDFDEIEKNLGKDLKIEEKDIKKIMNYIMEYIGKNIVCQYEGWPFQSVENVKIKEIQEMQK